MRLPVVPFLTPPPDAISHGGWFLTSEDGDVPLPREMQHWDYQTRLDLAAPVAVNRRAVTDACELEWDSGLAVLVLARSNHTNAEVVAVRLEVPLSDEFDLAVKINLPGGSLGGRLTLETLLVATKPRPRSRLSPQHSGSILWRVSHWTDLEGVGAQFPTDTVDFTQTGRDPKAGWELRIDTTDPEAHFFSAARLTLNSGHPSITRLLNGEKDEATAQLLRVLNWDVTRQMVMAALGSDDVASLEFDVDAVTVVGVLRNLLASIWPVESVITLRNWHATDPSRLEVALQHHCGVPK